MQVRIGGELRKVDEKIAYVGDTPIVEKRCEICMHIWVCAIYRAIKPLMENWPEDHRPFEASEVAKICKAFMR